MEIKSTQIKILRCDFDTSISNGDKISEVQKTKFEVGVDADGKWFRIRWTINIINQKNNSEVLGWLSEKAAYYELENETKDKLDLKRYFENYFVNITSHIQNNVPQKVKLMEQV